MKELFNKVKKVNGEGLMLKAPASMYEPGRSPSLRKYKGFFDTEVRFIRVEDGEDAGLLCEQYV